MEVDFSNSSKEEIEFFYKKISTNIKKYRLEKGLLQKSETLEHSFQKYLNSVYTFI